MPTINQLVKNKQRLQKRRRTKVLSLRKCPQKKGVCTEIRNSVSPRKPNSGKRKVARVRLSTGRMVTAAIPGQSHNLQKFSVVLVRGGHARDIPGVRYKLIKGKYDFSTFERIVRMKRRSKFGLSRDDVLMAKKKEDNF